VRPSFAILDPFSGISGDMTLGALVGVGLDPAWLEGLPNRLGLGGVGVRVHEVSRGGLAATKVDFEIPEQPHGRHLTEIRGLIATADLRPRVRDIADRVFRGIAEIEGEAHGVSPEDVHLHEVGAVDAILDVVGVVGGFVELGLERVYCGAISLGDGFVRAAHGVLPVPAPATLRLLEGHRVRPGPEGTGELVTPTGAALVQALSLGPPPASWIPRRVGLGAGSRDLVGRPNVLRLVVADFGEEGEDVESLVQLVCDLDDMPAEGLGAAAEVLLGAGARDVVILATLMKKGRPGMRLEVLCSPGEVSRLETLVFLHTTTLGVRRVAVERRSLARAERRVVVDGHPVRVKVATLPNGERRSKAEFDDVVVVARATGRSVAEVSRAALDAAERS
jgi:uncharacterized protein (TIGR00299 family) protein